MNQGAYKLNQEIAQFVMGKTPPYTISELAYVNQYIGFGGMWNFEADLKKERGLYEYYTPIPIVEKMVGLAHHHGFTGGKVLEPSCGIGRILHYFSPEASVTGIELDEVSYRIAKANFPTFDIRLGTFNALFADRTGVAQTWKMEYNLVIGNPPYGDFTGKGTAAEKQITKAANYVEYFITRGLDLLLPGGILVYIIPSSFIDGKENDCKRDILAKAEMLDAYRLPKRVFEATDVQTDIVVFKKK